MSAIGDDLVFYPWTAGLVLLLLYVILAVVIYRFYPKPWWPAVFCALSLLVVSLIISEYRHHTVQRGWEEKSTANSVSVHYGYFNGTYTIPVQAHAGQTLHLHVSISGGQFYSCHQPDGQPAYMMDNVGGDAANSDVKITQTGTYTLITGADHVENGAFSWSWKLTDNRCIQRGRNLHENQKRSTYPFAE